MCASRRTQSSCPAWSVPAPARSRAQFPARASSRRRARRQSPRSSGAAWRSAWPKSGPRYSAGLQLSSARCGRPSQSSGQPCALYAQPAATPRMPAATSLRAPDADRYRSAWARPSAQPPHAVPKPSRIMFWLRCSLRTAPENSFPLLALTHKRAIVLVFLSPSLPFLSSKAP